MAYGLCLYAKCPQLSEENKDNLGTMLCLKKLWHMSVLDKN